MTPARQPKRIVRSRQGGGSRRTSTTPKPKPGRPPLIEVGWDAAKGTWRKGSVADEIIEAIGKGNFLYVAAAAAGVSRNTVQKWLARAREWAPDLQVDRADVPIEQRPYVDFLSAITRAEAGAHRRWVQRLDDAGDKDWRAALELLKRRYPEWGDRATVAVQPADHSEPDGFRRLLDTQPGLAAAAEELAVAYEVARAASEQT